MKYAVCEYVDGVLNDCMLFSEYDRAFNEYMKRFVYYFNMNGKINPNLKIAYVYEGEIERFASNVVKFLGNDYEVKTSDGNYTITLSEDARRQFELNKRPCFYIYFIFNTNFLGEAAVSLRSYTISARVRRPGCFGSDIAIILERTVRMCDFDSLYDINFCDLDELYSAIRRTYENNFRCIEILD